LDHRAARQKNIGLEINKFLLNNFAWLVFFLFMLVKRVYVEDMNCEFELAVFVLYYSYQLFAARQFILDRDSMESYLAGFTEEFRPKQKIRIIKAISNNVFQAIFFVLLLIYSVKKSNGQRLLPYWAVFIPEIICLILNLFLSRWPNNPCQSL